MIIIELKKLLIKQKGLPIIILFIILKAAALFQSPYDSHYFINRNPEGYRFYMEQYKGRLNPAKEKAINEEYYSVGRAAGELEEISKQWQAGTISRDEYESRTKEYYVKKKNQAVFGIVFNQYHYAKQDPENRYMMDERGWSTLLCHSEADILLLLCLIVLLAPLFCQEYESTMDTLLLTSLNGRRKTCVGKLAVGGLLACGITVLFSLMEYICLDQKVGLSDGEFPLQSLEFFQDSPYDITLYQAFLLVVFCRALGALMLSGIISLAAVLSRNSIITLFVGSLLVLLPYAFFQDKSLLYLIPLPSGLLSAVGYLWGTSYTPSFGEHGNVVRTVQFRGIDENIFIWLLAGFTVETAGLLYLCMKKYSGTGSGYVHKKALRSICSVLVMSLLSMSLTGCGTAPQTEKLLTLDAKKSLFDGQTSKYHIHFDIFKNDIIAESKETGEEIELLRGPFDTGIKIQAIYVYNEWCYYLVKIPNERGIRIYGLSMDQYRNELIYNNIPTNSYTGLFTSRSDRNIEAYEIFASQGSIFCFFLDEDYIYYGIDSQLIQINRKSGREAILAMDVLEWGSIYYHNGNIFYVDVLHRLNIYNEKEDKVQIIDMIFTDQFSLEGDLLIYQDLLDNDRLKEYRLNTISSL